MKKKYIRPRVEVVMGKLEESCLLGYSNGQGGAGAYAPKRKREEEWEEEWEEW